MSPWASGDQFSPRPTSWELTGVTGLIFLVIAVVSKNKSVPFLMNQSWNIQSRLSRHFAFLSNLSDFR